MSSKLKAIKEQQDKNTGIFINIYYAHRWKDRVSFDPIVKMIFRKLCEHHDQGVEVGQIREIDLEKTMAYCIVANVSDAAYCIPMSKYPRPATEHEVEFKLERPTKETVVLQLWNTRKVSYEDWVYSRTVGHLTKKNMKFVERLFNYYFNEGIDVHCTWRDKIGAKLSGHHEANTLIEYKQSVLDDWGKVGELLKFVKTPTTPL